MNSISTTPYVVIYQSHAEDCYLDSNKAALHRICTEHHRGKFVHTLTYEDAWYQPMEMVAYSFADKKQAQAAALELLDIGVSVTTICTKQDHLDWAMDVQRSVSYDDALVN
jgi:hypothetical protein